VSASADFESLPGRRKHQAANRGR